LLAMLAPGFWGCEMAGKAVTSSMDEEAFKHSDASDYPSQPMKTLPGLPNPTARDAR
jgi:hypothetical protein